MVPSPSERRQSLSSLVSIKMYIFSGNYASSSAYFRVSSRIKSRRRRLVTKIIRNFSGTQRILFFFFSSKFLGDLSSQRHFFHPSNIAIFSSRIHRILLEILPYRFRVESFTTSLRSKLRSLFFFFYILSSEGRYVTRLGTRKGWIELKKLVENSFVSRDVRSRKIRGRRGRGRKSL